MDSATIGIFLTSKLTPLLRLARQVFLRAEIPSGTVAAGRDYDLSRSIAAVDDGDIDDIAIATDLALMLRHGPNRAIWRQ
jgi:hypothetical protein